MFKGTPTVRPPRSSRGSIETHGGQDNAFTCRDVTAYYVTVAADQLDLVLDLEADRMRNLLLDPREIDAERKVVIEERRTRTEDDPVGALAEEFNAVAFTAHPYRLPTIGFAQDIERLTAADLRAWYDVYYRPNNAILVASSATSGAAELLDEVRTRFGGIPRGADPPPVAVVEPEQRGERRVWVRKEAQLPVVFLGYPRRTTSRRTRYALEVLSTVLSGGRASRLYQRLVYEQRLALEAGGDYSRLTLDPDLFTFYATVLPDTTVEEAERALAGRGGAAPRGAVSDEELQRAKNQIEAAFVFGQDSVFNARASTLARYELVGGWRLREAYLPGIRAVTAEDLQRVAEQYLVGRRRTTAILVPVPPGRVRDDGPPDSSATSTRKPSAATATRSSTGSPTTSRIPSRYPVLSRVKPGDVRAALPPGRPRRRSRSTAILADFERIIVPGLTHWNHPGFFAYFAITGSAPGILGELLAARAQRQRDALAHLAGGHRAGGGRPRLAAPAPRAARRVPRRHLRHRVDLDPAAPWPPRARRRASTCASRGWPAARTCRGSASTRSEQAHSSVEKAAIVLGLGQDGCGKIPADARVPDATSPRSRARSPRTARPAAALRRRRHGGHHATTSVDPVPAIAEVCRARGALAARRRRLRRASAAILPERRARARRLRARRLARHEPAQVALHADRLLSVLYCRRPDVLQARLHPRARVPRRRRRDAPSRTTWTTAPSSAAASARSSSGWCCAPSARSGLEARLREHMRLGAAVRRVGRRRPGLGAHGAGPVQHGRASGSGPGRGPRTTRASTR